MPPWPAPTLDQAARLAALAQADVTERWRYYEQLAAVQRTVPQVASDVDPEAGPDAGDRDERGGQVMTGPDSVDLRTTYLGLQLSSPIVASAGPLTRDVEGAKALADAGAGALVLPSLFEEEIVAEEVGLSFALEAGSEHFAEALDYFPAVTNFTTAADRYLELLEQTKKAVEVPVIASLNASSTGGWVPLREASRRGRRGCPRAERVPGPDRPAADRGAGGGGGPGPGRATCAPACHCRSP